MKPDMLLEEEEPISFIRVGKPITGSRGIDIVLKHQMALANENPLDGASSKCIPPCVQILEGPAPSLGFLFGAFSCCFAHAPSVLGLV